MLGSELHVVDSAPLRYLLSVPPTPRPAINVWPVLCFLHGYAEAAPLEIHQALTRHGPLRQNRAYSAADHFLIIAPQLSPRGGDIWHRYADTVLQIVTEVQEMYLGDPRRTYLTGFSYGGNGVMDLALVQPHFWAALWPVDPTRIPIADPQRPLWLSFGEVSRRRQHEFIRTLGLQPASATLNADRLYLDQGQDHAGSATFAYRDDRIYTWLLAKELPAP